ncbi:cell envelope biogenesis protein AsmA [Neiella marina]|uniref:Cell envelope biogenesis protein AsmA n=1 Tax=Neiella marina TaxID=508461 RepID=A0A8J2XNZ7_9GAMM|nr:AsmA family protein [Neiella marina]GGA85947.1 cell envelope biogenesis protein AsmA [Neiella marina]
MKKLIYIVGGLFAALLLVVVIITVVFDPNDYKDEISTAVKDATGRELIIGGDIGWNLFPSFGLGLADVSFSNPQGFPEPTMASLKSLDVSVAMLPLLGGTLKVSHIAIDDVKLNLITLADGTDNLSDLKSGSSTAKSTEPEAQSSGQKGLSGVELGAISITNIAVNVDNRQLGSKQLAELKHFKLNQFVPGARSDASLALLVKSDDTEIDVAIEAAITIASSFDVIELHELALDALIAGPSIPNGQLKKHVSGKGNINLAGPTVDLQDIQIEVGSLTGSGWFKFRQQAVPDIQVALAFDTLNVDEFTPVSNGESPEQAKKTPSDPDAEPDLSALKSLNFDGDLSFNKVLVAGLTVTNVKLHANLKDGVLDANPIHLDLYGGSADARAVLNAQQAVGSYRSEFALKSVQALPLLTDLADLKMVSGNANFDMNIRGTGLSTNKLKSASAGNGKFLFADGALEGVNIAQMIRSAKALLKGEKAPEEEKKTDFSSLSGSFTLAKGVATNPDLKLASPLLRVDGEGSMNVMANTLDYTATTEIVATSKGQGGADAEDLKGLKVPLKVSGPLDDLKYGIDFEEAMKGEYKEKLEKEKDKGLKKLSDKLGDFLGGKD